MITGMERILMRPSDDDDRSIDFFNCDEQDEEHLSHAQIQETKEIIAEKETQMVNCSKLLVLSVIFAVASTMGLSTYIYLDRQQDRTHQSQFDNFSNEIIEFSLSRAESLFNSLATLSATCTVIALDNKQTWPFVRIPSFEVLGMMTNEITGAATIDLVPLVRSEDRADWEDFSVANQGWIQEGHMYREHAHHLLYKDETQAKSNVSSIEPFIFRQDENWAPLPDVNWTGFYAPLWQRAPADDHPSVNFNIRNFEDFDKYLLAAIENEQPVLSSLSSPWYLLNSYDGRFTEADLASPFSYIFQPIYDSFYENRTVVGVLASFLQWDNFFVGLTHESDQVIIIVIEGTCGDLFTYHLQGEAALFMGYGDLHNHDYDDMVREFDFAPFATIESTEDKKLCQYTASIYPSSEWSSTYFSNKPYLYAGCLVLCFVFTTFAFVIYDVLVQKRQDTVMDKAMKTNAIVSSLFPSNVKDRLIEELDQGEKVGWSKGKRRGSEESNAVNRAMTSAEKSTEAIFGSKPIADLFPETTIMFADIAGFTAWSSTREPAQVFVLLELLYHAFDMIARRMRVFKVETIGDCYVAVAGLPTPRKDHAVVMARFATDCLVKMQALLTELETSLGPDTADLGLRVGLHSGPVTAGVLRGDKGRFQLFGDTMNTASRMESTGQKNRIHCSQETAEQLRQHNKGNWLTMREERVIAKGKGELQTFWVVKETSDTQSNTTTTLSEVSVRTETKSNQGHMETKSTMQTSIPERTTRLIMWTTETLIQFLKGIVAKREALARIKGRNAAMDDKPVMENIKRNRSILAEAADVMTLPRYNAEIEEVKPVPESVTLSDQVLVQLKDFVTTVALLYKDNAFHNFEHASHVTMSVNKLVTRIAHPTPTDIESPDVSRNMPKTLHEHSLGISSDPLTQFACVFSALIHDLDHPGVPNSRLVLERDNLARLYENKSIAEQNSVDLAWDLLMNPRFVELRRCIYQNQSEHDRFRQLVVNMVMVTDIMDKDLNHLRLNRWNKAFLADNGTEGGPIAEQSIIDTAMDRKATVVLEHLIQASDVAHTMQHWHVYQKWNERLFFEMYQSYLDGRASTDPSEVWYQGELGFFDFYVIPLAKKLGTCGVFGVFSNEYLNYAQSNRSEWEKKGRNIVADYLARHQKGDLKLSGSSHGIRDQINDDSELGVSV